MHVCRQACMHVIIPVQCNQRVRQTKALLTFRTSCLPVEPICAFSMARLACSELIVSLQQGFQKNITKKQYRLRKHVLQGCIIGCSK